MGFQAPNIDDVRRAARAIEGVIVRTPLLRSSALDEKTKGRVFLKAEVLQRTGAFKFRGAYNRLNNMPAWERARGVVSFSSGNHAQAVACAASIFAVHAAIFMPSDAPAIKKSRTRGFGSTVIEYDRSKDDRAGLVKDYLELHGGALIHPFEDFDIIAGQGTLGLEIMEDLDALGVVPDAILVNASGGGLASGVATAVRAISAATRVVIAEPAGFDRFARSLSAGRRVANKRLSGSICDALLAVAPGENTFRITSELCSGAVSATDGEVLEAMAFAFEHLKLVVEPGGAAALAAVLAGRIDLSGQTSVIVLSGGNVDRGLFRTCIGAA